MIPSHIYFKNVAYKNIKLVKADNGFKFFVGRGSSEKEIEFDNISLELCPFFDLISIFKKEKIDDNKVCAWIQEYGFLNSSLGEVPEKRVFDYNSFINEAKTIVDLWIKFKEIRNREIKDLKKWLIAHDDFYDLHTSIYPLENIAKGVYSSDGSTVSFNMPIKDLTYREYQYAGFRYILNKITSRIKSVSFSINKIRMIDKEDTSKSFYGIKNSIIIPPDLLTALYLYFFQILHSNVRICPICLKPFNNRRSDAIACSPNHSNTYKKREQRKTKQ